MKILLIGDIFGYKGREAIKKELAKIKKAKQIDLVIANAENCTNCKSLSWNHYQELMNSGVDYFTFGNHTWSNKDIVQILDQNNTIRPANISYRQDDYNYIDWTKYGVGTRVISYKNKKIQITNLMGNSIAYIKKVNLTNAFVAMEEILKAHKSDIHIVDFHAETTSEKNAFLLAFASRVSAIVGTHTHVQTADNKIYHDTAYITDLGMTGPSLGVIGAKPDCIIDRFYGKDVPFVLESSDTNYQLCGMIVEFDEQTNKPIKTERVFILE